MKIDTEGLKSFIPTAEIMEHLQQNRFADASRIKDIVAKSLAKQRLNPDETAALINVTNPELKELILEGAHTLKERIYGNRIVLFAPLYVGNECINDVFIAVFAFQIKSAIGLL